MKTLSRCLSKQSFAELQRIMYRGPEADGINHRHWRTAEFLKQAVSPHTHRELQEGRTSRAPLHKILMNEVPPSVMNYSKKAIATDKLLEGEERGAVKITFDDGSTEIADVVVAADGINSKIRKHYHPDSKIGSRGRVAYRLTFPVSLIEGIKDLPNDTSSFRKHGEIVFLSRLGQSIHTLNEVPYNMWDEKLTSLHRPWCLRIHRSD